jgi:peptidoglycan hydrolase-like protein with peptidoglycan-binding domain
MSFNLGNLSSAANFLPYVFRAINNMDKISTVLPKLQTLAPEFIALYQKAAALVPEITDLLNTIVPGLIPTGSQPPHVVVPEPVPEGFTIDWVQDSLNKVMGANLTVDGQYGPRTHEALMSYQKSRGLNVDGWAGPLTCAKLFADVSALTAPAGTGPKPA